MKKTLSLVFLSFASLLFATLEPKPQHTPAQELYNADKPAFLINGEFLYWNVQEGALDYALRMKTRSWGPSPSFAQGTFERAEYNWDPGFRLSAGYYRAPNFWEVLLEYTYIHLKGFNHVKRPPMDESRFLTGTFPQIFTGPMSHANSRIHLHYELVNLFAHRVFHPFDNPHLRLRLIGGFTGLFAKQGWRVRYFDMTDNVTSTWNRWRYWGLGFATGIGFDWYFGKDIYMTGKFSLGLVTGHYHNHAKQETTFTPLPGDDPSIPIRNARFADYRMSMHTQFVLGPSYQRSFASWRIELFAGYEFNVWTNLQEIYRSTEAAPQAAKETWLNRGELALQGLTTRLTLNF